jgi:hypothetical protein
MPNISRTNMPQVATNDLDKAIDMVSNTVRITKGNIKAGTLKKSQKELFKDKVAGIAANFTNPNKLKPLIISKDNHIVDGHHRWAAAIEKWGNDVKIPIIRINLPILKAIEVYKVVANSINEDITIPINVGDTVLGGKFKNKRIVVKSIEKNEKGDITINGKPLLKYRLVTESADNLEMLQLMNKAMKAFPQSPKQKELIKKLNVLRVKNGMKPLGENVINEIPMGDLEKIDTFADKQLNPLDIVLTDRHFFDRLNDPRNGKEISNAELIGFFKRLSKKKKEFVEFLQNYNTLVATDDKTNINIPFMKQANKAIAKTIMRKANFKSYDPKLDI